MSAPVLPKITKIDIAWTVVDKDDKVIKTNTCTTPVPSTKIITGTTKAENNFGDFLNVLQTTVEQKSNLKVDYKNVFTVVQPTLFKTQDKTPAFKPNGTDLSQILPANVTGIVVKYKYTQK